MKLFTYIDRINLMHKLIKQRRTGTPEELARRLGLSVSRLARVVEYLRDQGAPIEYDRRLMTYYYCYPFEISISVSFQALDDYEMKRISGGSKLFSTFLSNAFFVH